MEPIIRVTVYLEDWRDDYTESSNHYFHSVAQAKRWCEKDIHEALKYMDKPTEIEWEQAKHVNPLVWWSQDIALKHQETSVTFHVEPINITVMDEEDGEI